MCTRRRQPVQTTSVICVHIVAQRAHTPARANKYNYHVHTGAWRACELICSFAARTFFTVRVYVLAVRVCPTGELWIGLADEDD